MGDAYVKWYRSQEYYDSGAWRGTWAMDGGGALMNQAIHSVDMLLGLMGDVSCVSAQTVSAFLHYCELRLKTTGGLSVQFLLTIRPYVQNSQNVDACFGELG